MGFILSSFKFSFKKFLSRFFLLVISSIGTIVVDGRVYPSVTPPSEPIVPVTLPPTESNEQKQMNNNSYTITTPMDNSSTPQSVSLLLSSQTSNNLTHSNAYVSQAMNIPISTHQQQMTMQSQHMSTHPQLQTQPPNYIQHYGTHNIQQQHPLPQVMQNYNSNYNGRLHQQQQQQQMMMSQRSGLGNCHQQVYWQRY